MHLDAQSVVGMSGTASTIVSPTGTAIAAGSGDLPVLATPRMIALMEEAARIAIAPLLPAGSTSVGTHVDVRHLAPSPLGAEVTATATVTAVEGARVRFDVTASHVSDGSTVPVGTGTHVRVVVDRERFLAGSMPRTT